MGRRGTGSDAAALRGSHGRGERSSGSGGIAGARGSHLRPRGARARGRSNAKEPLPVAPVPVAMKRILHYSMLVLLAGLALAARPANADAGGHARVSTVSGDLLVRGPDDADWSYLDRNAVVYDGDE